MRNEVSTYNTNDLCLPVDMEVKEEWSYARARKMNNTNRLMYRHAPFLWRRAWKSVSNKTVARRRVSTFSAEALNQYSCICLLISFYVVLIFHFA